MTRRLVYHRVNPGRAGVTAAGPEIKGVRAMNIKLIKAIFFIGALYDGFIGIMGILFPGLAFDLFQVVPPNHAGYVQFPAILLLIFGAMFYQVARDPVANRALMLYGVALKIGYSGLIFYYLLTTGIPAMWVPFAWADLAFLVLFVLSWRWAQAEARQVAPGT